MSRNSHRRGWIRYNRILMSTLRQGLNNPNNLLVMGQELEESGGEEVWVFTLSNVVE